MLSRIRQVGEGQRFDRLLGRGLEQHRRRSLRFSALQEGLAQQHQRFTRRVARHAPFQRFDGFLQQHGIVSGLGGLEPDTPERDEGVSIGGEAFSRRRENCHAAVELASLSQREAERYVARRGARVQRPQPLELDDLIVGVIGLTVQVCQLLARVEKRRRELHRSVQRHLGLFRLLQRVEAESHQVVRLRRPLVDLEGGTERIHGAVCVPRVKLGEGELVEDARRAIVDADVLLVAGRRPIVTTERLLDVSE